MNDGYEEMVIKIIRTKYNIYLYANSHYLMQKNDYHASLIERTKL